MKITITPAPAVVFRIINDLKLGDVFRIREWGLNHYRVIKWFSDPDRIAYYSFYCLETALYYSLDTLPDHCTKETPIIWVRDGEFTGREEG